MADLDNILDRLSMEDFKFNEEPITIETEEPVIIDPPLDAPAITVMDEETVETEIVTKVYTDEDQQERIEALSGKLVLARIITKALTDEGPLDSTMIEEAMNRYAYDDQAVLLHRTNSPSLRNREVLLSIRNSLINVEPDLFNHIVENFTNALSTLTELVSSVDADNTNELELFKNKVNEHRSNILITKDSSVNYTETPINELVPAIKTTPLITEDLLTLFDMAEKLDYSNANIKLLVNNITMLQEHALEAIDRITKYSETLRLAVEKETCPLDLIYGRDTLYDDIKTVTKLNLILNEFDLVGLINRILFPN